VVLYHQLDRWLDVERNAFGALSEAIN
jgi:hypothetical protein